MKANKILTIIVMFFVFASISFAAQISGTVTDAATGDGISGALVEVFSTSGVLQNSTTTDVNGLYSVDSIITGVLILNASHLNYNTQSIPKYIGGGGANVDFSLGPISAYRLNGVATPNSTGINIKLKQGSSTIYETFTTAGGSYELAVLPGNYVFEATFPNYNIYAATISITGNTSYNFIMTSAITTGNINGYVRNASGVALIGANVRLKFNGGIVSETTTDGTGYYLLTNIIPNNYNITASYAGYNDQTYAIAISANSTMNRDFNMSGAATTCSQSVSYGSWSTCSGGSQSRSVTYTNYQNVCNWTYVTTQTQSCSSSTSSGGGGASTSYNKFLLGIQPKTVYPDFFEENPVKYTLYKLDNVVFYNNNTKYSISVLDIVNDTVKLKFFPTYKEEVLEDGDIYNIDLGNDEQVTLTIIDVTIDPVYIDGSRATVNLYKNSVKQETKEEPKEEPKVVEKIKDAVVKVSGETVSKNIEPSVAVGASISGSVVILGLLIFFVVRRIFG